MERIGTELCAGVFVCTVFAVQKSHTKYAGGSCEYIRKKKKKLANRLNTMLFTSALFNKINCNAAIFICMSTIFLYISMHPSIYLISVRRVAHTKLYIFATAIISEENGMKRTNYWFWIHFRDLNTFNGTLCSARSTCSRWHIVVARIFKHFCFIRFNYTKNRRKCVNR